MYRSTSRWSSSESSSFQAGIAVRARHAKMPRTPSGMTRIGCSLHHNHGLHLMPGHVAEVAVLAGLGRREMKLRGAVWRNDDSLESFPSKFKSTVSRYIETYSRED